MPLRRCSQLERLPLKRKFGCLKPNRHSQRSSKQKITAPITNARQMVWVWRILQDTVPETFYFPIFAFVYRSLTVRSPCVQRALIVRSSFTVLCSPFTVRLRSPFAHRAFTYRSHSFHRSFSVQSPLSFGTLKLKDHYHDLGTKLWYRGRSLFYFGNVGFLIE